MRDYTFHPRALEEFKAEVIRYESLAKGLGEDFSESVFTAIDLACRFPEMGAPAGDGIRFLLTKRFPFLIYYELLRDLIFVWAVMYGTREPGYWRERRKGV